MLLQLLFVCKNVPFLPKDWGFHKPAIEINNLLQLFVAFFLQSTERERKLILADKGHTARGCNKAVARAVTRHYKSSVEWYPNVMKGDKRPGCSEQKDNHSGEDDGLS